MLQVEGLDALWWYTDGSSHVHSNVAAQMLHDIIKVPTGCSPGFYAFCDRDWAVTDGLVDRRGKEGLLLSAMPSTKDVMVKHTQY